MLGMEPQGSSSSIPLAYERQNGEPEKGRVLLKLVLPSQIPGSIPGASWLLSGLEEFSSLSSFLPLSGENKSLFLTA